MYYVVITHGNTFLVILWRINLFKLVTGYMEMVSAYIALFLHPSQWAPKALYNAFTHSPFTHTLIHQWRPGMPSTGAYEPRPIGGNLG